MTDKDTIEIRDLDQFVRTLVSWHSNKVKTLEHMMLIPENSEIEANGVITTMDGDYRRGFIDGIDLALIELGKLPFAYEVESYEEPTNDPITES